MQKKNIFLSRQLPFKSAVTRNNLVVGPHVLILEHELVIHFLIVL